VTAFASGFETIYGNKNVTAVKGIDPDGKPVGGNMYTTVEQEYDLHVGTNRHEQVDKDYELTVKGDVRTDLQGNVTAVVKGDVSIGVKSLTVEASETITLKVGSSFIVIDHCEIHISAPLMIYINSGGSPNSAASMTMHDIADATLAEPGDQWNTRLTPCKLEGGGGSPGTRPVVPPTAPPCDGSADGVSCDFLPGGG